MEAEVLKNNDFIGKELKKYNLSDAAIAQMKKEYLPIKVESFEDVENYMAAKDAHQKVKGVRIDIEKKRKELKASSLEFGRAVDGEAKRLTSAVSEIEEHLARQRAVVDDEKKRRQREKEEAIRREEEQKKREEEERMEARRREQEERERKLQEAQEKIEAEKRKIAEEKEIIRAEKEAEERKKQEEKERQEREKQEKVRLEKARKEAAEQAKRDAEEKARREAFEKEEQERRKKEEEQARLAEEQRQRELRPDVEKLKEFSQQLKTLQIPQVKSHKAMALLADVKSKLEEIAKYIANAKL